MTLAHVAAPLVLAVFGLAGCSSDNEPSIGAELARGVTAQIVPGKAKAAPPADGGFTRAQLNRVNAPLMIVAVPKLSAVALVGPMDQNGPVTTWLSADDKTVATRGGMIVATRGLGADLMSATVPGPQQVAAGSGQTQRSYYHLDGNDQSVRTDVTCTLSSAGSENVVIVEHSYATRHVVESCADAVNLRFDNHFWFDGSGNIRQSTQWIGPLVGMMETKRAND